jgi:glycosyltransferase involved in cell wall biosynthesis
LRWIDRAALRAARLVVADTDANARYLAELARVPTSRFEVCLVGAEERVFTPGWSDGDAVVFVGKLIPLHGVETILEAARLAPEVPVRIVGSGQLDSLLEQRPSNVEWIPWIEYERLPAVYKEALCVLGIFGASGKARRVIPNKVFQALASGAPVLTADTPAARELLADGESALLVPPSDPAAIAAAMRRLAEDGELRARIADGGHRAYREQASEQVLGERWRRILTGLL